MTEVVEASTLCTRLANVIYFTATDDEPSMSQAAQRGFPFYADRDPLDALACAARGDLAAMREIADAAVYITLSGAQTVDPVIALSEGLMLARMAAALGDPDDKMRVVAMLSLLTLLSTGEGALDAAGEAVARLELLADVPGKVGEDAAQLLAATMQEEHPETIAMAKDYRQRLAKLELN